MPTATQAGHPIESSWPGKAHLLSLSQPYKDHDHVVVCLQDERYGLERCAKVFLADETGTYTGGAEFKEADRFDHGTLEEVANRFGYTVA